MITWQIRYAALLERHQELCDVTRSILEVGSGPQGIARHLNRSVVGVDRAFGGPLNPNLTAVAGSVLNLPFADDAFDYVICVDTLEHLRECDRSVAIRELVRVARTRVIITGPIGAFAAFGDSAYASHIAQTGGSIPPWLSEHLENGIPTLGSVIEALWGTGYAFQVHVNEGFMQHYGGLFVDGYPFMAPFIKRHEEQFGGELAFRATPSDVPYSYQLTVDVTAPRAATSAPTRPDRPDVPVASNSAAQKPSSFGLFAIGHRADRMLRLPGIKCVLAGAIEGAPPHVSEEMLCDNSGENIVERNLAYSEMTAIYWVWKNIKNLDAVGFCHYRRYFDFRQNVSHAERQSDLTSPQQVAAYATHFADRSVIDQHIGDGAIIVARPQPLPIPVGEQYMWDHFAADYLAMVNYVLAHYPHLASQLITQLGARLFYSNNMFVMPWPHFERLCNFWFDCLFGIEKTIVARPGPYQRRTLAFLSERLLDLHFRWLRDGGQSFVEYPIFFLRDGAFAVSS